MATTTSPDLVHRYQNIEYRPRRPATRRDFEIAIICALTIEADAVGAILDTCWDEDGHLYDKPAGDPNAYTTGVIGRHNVVLVHMPGTGKANAATVAANCRASFPNIKLAVVVGVCGAVPFGPDKEEIILGDVIISEGVVQYDFGRLLPERFERKDTLLNSLGRPNAEIRALLAKLKGLRGRRMLRNGMAKYMGTLQAEPSLAAGYPGTERDRLFEAQYRHAVDGKLCEECGCNGKLVRRSRLEQGDPQPTVHFGLIASGDTVMNSGADRDAIVGKEKGVIAFEMEGAGVWDSFPCVVIKSACVYADSHKTKAWQRYAAATAAACMKAFLDHWVPQVPGCPPLQEEPTGPWFIVPYAENTAFTGRQAVLSQLQQRFSGSGSQPRIALFGPGGVGKTQIALAYAYWLRQTSPKVSVYWIYASNAEQFQQAYTSIARECQVPGSDDPKADILSLVKTWLERKDQGRWLMVIDNADDMRLFFDNLADSSKGDGTSTYVGRLARYIPECAHGCVLVTTRNKQAALSLAPGNLPIEVGKMDNIESETLLRTKLKEHPTSKEFISVSEYLELLDDSDQNLVDLLSEEFETVGRDSETPRAVAETWILSFEQIQWQNALATDLLSLMSLFDRQAIPSEFLTHYYNRQNGQEQRGKLPLTRALGVLKAFSFATEDRDHKYDLHQLVQLVIRRWLIKRGKISQFAEEALIVVSQAYPYGNYESRGICSAYLPHVYAVLKLEGSGSRDERLARASLFHCAAGFFLYQGHWKDAESFLVEARGLRQAELGEEHPSTLYSIASLAATYGDQGRWKEAESLQVQVMETSKRVLGLEHPDTLSSIANLAVTYGNQGRWKEAESLQVQVMETSKRVLGLEHPDTLSSIANLAVTYGNQGRWKEAESLQVQVVEMRKRVLGLEHPDTLASMNNLAVTWEDQGRLDDALDLMRQCIRLRQKSFYAT
ncbi:Kinesin light chain 3 [Madurella mycetomatis]|uniref:Kinesin light chain 3 n=1 Tax=Madurella mycetomatis TaxID=100816 RepID=A0A175VTT8_9PEZI|nr:Kinesin light chain 3 [Madurella mycetomatis]